MGKETQREGFIYPFSAVGDDMDSQMEKSWQMAGHAPLAQPASFTQAIKRETPVVSSPLPQSNDIVILSDLKKDLRYRSADLPPPQQSEVFASVGDD